MGADIFYDIARFRPRRTKVFLNKRDRWEIYTDRMFSGYVKTGKSVPNDDTALQIFKNLGFEIVTVRPGSPTNKGNK